MKNDYHGAVCNQHHHHEEVKAASLQDECVVDVMFVVRTEAIGCWEEKRLNPPRD